jgi:hypothetical protein
MTRSGQDHVELFDGWPERYDRSIAGDSFPLAGHLASEGRVLIGDVAFPDATARDECHRARHTAWDEGEHCGAAESIRTALEAAGSAVAYEQVPFRGGVLSLHRAAAS